MATRLGGGQYATTYMRSGTMRGCRGHTVGILTRPTCGRYVRGAEGRERENTYNGGLAIPDDLLKLDSRRFRRVDWRRGVSYGTIGRMWKRRTRSEVRIYMFKR